jgi:hypothetical protein
MIGNGYLCGILDWGHKLFIINPEKIKNKFECNYVVAKYLMDRNIPLLSIKGGIYYFADTELLKEIWGNAPFWIKILHKF